MKGNESVEGHHLAATSPNDEIDIRQIIQRLWDGKWTILLVTVLCSLAAIAYALRAPEIYRSEALVQPRHESKSAGVLTLATQFSGLTDLYGGAIDAGGFRAVALATLESRAVIEQFIREKDLLPKMYAGAWDPIAKNWKDTNPERVPTTWEAYSHFVGGILKVEEDKRTGLVTIAIEWSDARESQQWVTELIARANGYLKANAIREGEKNLDYLEQQLRSIEQVELRRALYGVVEAELKKLMLAQGGEEFAFKTIDPAVTPKKRIRPVRRQIAVLGFLTGGFAGVLLVLARSVFRKQ